MTSEQRTKASHDQINRFFSSYWSHWRLAKILINEKVLYSRYEFLANVASEVLDTDAKNPEAKIAQELKSGLEFDSLANCMLYIEDLFALLLAGQNLDYFIRNITTYRAGKVDGFIKKEFSDVELRKLFHFYFLEKYSDPALLSAIEEGTKNLRNRLSLIRTFYNKYLFFFLQYKHGLTIALRPYGEFDNEQIQKDKSNSREPYLVAFDNLSITKVFKDKDRFQDYVMMPALTKNTVPFLGDLEKEDNLLRFVMSPPSTTLQNIKNCAIQIRECMHIFINNLLNSIADQSKIISELPMKETGNVYRFDASKKKPYN